EGLDGRLRGPRGPGGQRGQRVRPDPAVRGAAGTRRRVPRPRVLRPRLPVQPVHGAGAGRRGADQGVHQRQVRDHVPAGGQGRRQRRGPTPAVRRADQSHRRRRRGRRRAVELREVRAGPAGSGGRPLSPQGRARLAGAGRGHRGRPAGLIVVSPDVHPGVAGESPTAANIAPMTPRLIVSVSGLRDSVLDDAVDLVEALDRRSVPVALLVAPRRGHEYRLAEDAPTQQWLRHRRGLGDSIVLGGYDEAATRRRRPEFASLGPAEAAARLAAADRLMAEMGLRTRLFAPPRWDASPGCLEALPGAGFRLCASLDGVYDVVRGTVDRGRALSMGEGFLADGWWCRALVAAAGRTAE